MIIRVHDLFFTYLKAHVPAVRNLCFEIARGEVFGFLGPSGAGKSTTQKLLIGLLRNYQGSIRIFDRDLANCGADYYERIGVSFEFPNHYLRLTALENLNYFAKLYSRATQSPSLLLKLVGLEDDANLLVARFSKGMKGRLSVARALLHDPELLFLDEPTAGLDPVNGRRITELIRAQQQAGKTIFLTTHDMAVADQLCDRVAFIVDGQIKLIDAPRTLKLRHGQRKVRVEYRVDSERNSQDFELDGLGNNDQFLTLLRESEIQTMHTLEASLADIFIQVTGRGLV